jgi:hypothetical protein
VDRHKIRKMASKSTNHIALHCTTVHKRNTTGPNKPPKVPNAISHFVSARAVAARRGDGVRSSVGAAGERKVEQKPAVARQSPKTAVGASSPAAASGASSAGAAGEPRPLAGELQASGKGRSKWFQGVSAAGRLFGLGSSVGESGLREPQAASGQHPIRTLSQQPPSLLVLSEPTRAWRRLLRPMKMQPAQLVTLILTMHPTVPMKRPILNKVNCCLSPCGTTRGPAQRWLRLVRIDVPLVYFCCSH